MQNTKVLSTFVNLGLISKRTDNNFNMSNMNVNIPGFNKMTNKEKVFLLYKIGVYNFRNPNIGQQLRNDFPKQNSHFSNDIIKQIARMSTRKIECAPSRVTASNKSFIEKMRKLTMKQVKPSLRKVPKNVASSHAIGTIRKGLDGFNYIVAKTKGGQLRWKKQ